MDRNDGLNENPDSGDTDNNVNNSPAVVPTFAEQVFANVIAGFRRELNVFTLLHQTGEPSRVTIASFFAFLYKLLLPDANQLAFLLKNCGDEAAAVESAARSSRRRFSLELCKDKEANSLVITSASLYHIRGLIERVLEHSPDCWYWQQMRRVDACNCGHEFHCFVRDTLLDFLCQPCDDLWGRNRATINVRRDPWLQLRYNGIPFFRTPLEFLLAYLRYLDENLDLRYNAHQWKYRRLLKSLVQNAVERCLTHSRDFTPPKALPDACAAAETSHTCGSICSSSNNQIINSDYIFASRNQADVQAFGESAGRQCLAMSGVAMRLHGLLGGSFCHVTSSVLDCLLDVGNWFYKICLGSTGFHPIQYRYLDFHDLETGMERFDRQGWPGFTHELNANSWDNLQEQIQARLEEGDDGFLVIYRQVAFAVMRDQATGRLFLFDSHGFDRLPTSAAGGCSGQTPAYLRSFDSLHELFSDLRVRFGCFEAWCEVHAYKIAHH